MLKKTKQKKTASNFAIIETQSVNFTEVNFQWNLGQCVLDVAFSGAVKSDL